jgi:hypothetical protein
MKPDQLETRLAAMEKQLADIRTLLEERLEPKRDWRNSFGAFTGDPVAKKVAEEIRKAREKDRRETMPKDTPRRKKPLRASA